MALGGGIGLQYVGFTLMATNRPLWTIMFLSVLVMNIFLARDAMLEAREVNATPNP